MRARTLIICAALANCVAAGLFILYVLPGRGGVPQPAAGEVRTAAPPAAAPAQHSRPSAPPAAASAQPQPTPDVRQLVLLSDLRTLRSQLELYAVQHRNRFPQAERIEAQLTGKTDVDGQLCQDGYNGPYLKKFPSNPFVPNSAAASEVKFGSGPCRGDGSSGWYFDAATNTLWANDAAHKGL